MNDTIICTTAIILDPSAAFMVGDVGALSHYIIKKTPCAVVGNRREIGAVIMVVGYSLGSAFICSTPEYAILKLPYQILQAGVGAVLSMVICRKFKLKELFYKKGLPK